MLNSSLGAGSLQKRAPVVRASVARQGVASLDLGHIVPGRRAARAVCCAEGKFHSSRAPFWAEDGPLAVAARAAFAGTAAVLLCGSLTFGNVDSALAKTKISADEQKVVDLFAKNTSAVVNITNLLSRRDAFTSDMQEYPQGAGSGIVWDREGHILTNYHVIKGATTVQVTLNGGQEYIATVIGQDEDRDVAVLQIKDQSAEEFKPVTLGTSSDIMVGQKVYAIGNPFGLDHTLTTGIVSGVGREIQSGITGRPIQDAIQTDAAINPGNSGGPLLDSGGDLIGINTAIYSPSGANSGVGFAIPIDTVKTSVAEIIQYGKVVRPVLGIAFAPDQSTNQLGVNGILVLSVREGGPADKAGLRGTTRDTYGRLVLGDIIISVDGKAVKNGSDLYKILDKYKIGQTLDLECLRTSSKEHLAVTLEASVPLQMQAALKVEPMNGASPTGGGGGSMQERASGAGGKDAPHVCVQPRGERRIPSELLSCIGQPLTDQARSEPGPRAA